MRTGGISTVMPLKAHLVVGRNSELAEHPVLYLHHHLAAVILKKIAVFAAGQLFNQMPLKHAGRIVLSAEHVNGARDGWAHAGPLKPGGKNRQAAAAGKNEQQGGKQIQKNGAHCSHDIIENFTRRTRRGSSSTAAVAGLARRHGISDRRVWQILKKEGSAPAQARLLFKLGDSAQNAATNIDNTP